MIVILKYAVMIYEQNGFFLVSIKVKDKENPCTYHSKELKTHKAISTFINSTISGKKSLYLKEVITI